MSSVFLIGNINKSSPFFDTDDYSEDSIKFKALGFNVISAPRLYERIKETRHRAPTIQEFIKLLYQTMLDADYVHCVKGELNPLALSMDNLAVSCGIKTIDDYCEVMKKKHD